MSEKSLSYEELQGRLATAEAAMEALRREQIELQANVAELTKARDSLIESEGRYRALFENMNAGFVLFEVVQDDRGVPVDLIVVAANKGFESTTGLIVEEVVGKHLTQVLPGIEGDAANWIGRYGRIALTGESQQFEDGSELLGYYYSVIAYQAGPKQCAVTFIDVTERKKAEAEREALQEQLLQAQKMESIGRLAGGVAHDFNNVLVPIIGYVDLAMMSLSPDEKLYVNLQRVREAAERAAGLTRQILAFSRKQVLEMRVLDLNAVVSDFEKMIQRLIGEDIALATFLEPALGRIEADPGQLEQVLLNLAVNARDAMPTGGKLALETANVYLDDAYVQKYADSQPPGHYVMLAVSDTGYGMSPEIKRNIFEPFFTTKEQGKGTGLGLATVFGIVKQHRGNIWVYSEPGSGTTFKIYLPRVEAPAKISGTTALEPESVYGTETILVVEDEVMVRQLVCETLAAFGYQVIEAKSAADGLRLAMETTSPLHLLLTDVIMPEINGRQLYQKLAGIRPEIKVLYMSGYTDNVIVHHGILDEGINFLQKPFSVQSLTRKVKQVLG
ncbi:MAG: hypothetical protein Kow0031_34390 [Anaerolineae bacterium]